MGYMQVGASELVIPFTSDTLMSGTRSQGALPPPPITQYAPPPVRGNAPPSSMYTTGPTGPSPAPSSSSGGFFDSLMAGFKGGGSGVASGLVNVAGKALDYRTAQLNAQTANKYAQAPVVKGGVSVPLVLGGVAVLGLATFLIMRRK